MKKPRNHQQKIRVGLFLDDIDTIISTSHQVSLEMFCEVTARVLTVKKTTLCCSAQELTFTCTDVADYLPSICTIILTGQLRRYSSNDSENVQMKQQTTRFSSADPTSENRCFLIFLESQIRGTFEVMWFSLLISLESETLKDAI